MQTKHSQAWWNREKKVHIGCGPNVRLSGWLNVDQFPWPNVDLVTDVTKFWPFAELEAVYAEHFLQAIKLEDAVQLLIRITNSLKVGSGVARIATPNMRWAANKARRSADPIEETISLNRSFHAWSHEFLWTYEFLRFLLEEIGAIGITECEPHKSNHENFVDIEQHGSYTTDIDGNRSSVIVEFSRGNQRASQPEKLFRYLSDNYYSHYSGH